MLEALANGVKGRVWFSLMDKVCAERTLLMAWEQVQSNAGACGVDGISVKHFGKDSLNRLLAVKEQLRQGSYVPSAVKRVWIPKAGGAGKRPLGIPTVRDRVVQTALKMVIEPIFEHEFAPHSYGFRPGRGCKDALRRVDRLLKGGLVHVVDVDIKGYFDSIPHGRLLELVKERICDGKVLGLVESMLKQGVMEQMEEVEGSGVEQGTPQGGVISPLLANIYLNPLDWLMSQKGLEMVRYADDMVILCESATKAQEAYKILREWMTQAGLELHPQKTKLVDMGQPKASFEFLGYQFKRSGHDGRIKRYIRPRSLKKVKRRIKPMTKRANAKSLNTIIARLNPVLRGVYGYFAQAAEASLEALDGWVRGRLRSILRHRSKRDGRARGKDHQRWPNHYFEELGLYSLIGAQEEACASLRRGANC
ncbi:group II intron reverse transcriptase/maturase [Verrucomicrobium sp. BvORR034]|uniref:group II intron reverse transcriptase/maturase n=1 Tax=Verrucomicrobium sp. BvORR034 TaxID=1396418 RepID=UPI000678B5BC|nr:group II intron reverse transcriptase/maturase [Verrucomicrobium sp. BvORR034]